MERWLRPWNMLLLLAVMLAAYPAAAEPPAVPPLGRDLFEMPLDELMELRVPDVTTASKRSEKATDAPGTVVVIDKRDIRLRGYATLSDVLRDLPGMETIPYYFSEIGTLVPVRGIVGNNKIVVLVNGMRINPPGGEYVPLRNDISVRYAEQIEIVYGPGSTLYGEDAIAAVINIITADAESGRRAEAGGLAGDHDAREGWATINTHLGANREVHLLVHARFNESNLSPLDEDYPAWWAAYESVAAPKGSGSDPVREERGLNLFARLDTRHSALQVWHRQSRRSSSEGFNPILGFVPEAVWEDMTTVVEGMNRWPLAEAVQLESRLTYRRYEIDPDTRYVFPASETEWFYNDFKYGVGNGFSLEETLQIDLHPDLCVMAGGAAASYNITPKATVPGGADPDGDIHRQSGSFVYFTEPANPGSRREVPRVITARYQTYAAYTEGAWKMTDALKLIAGIRLTDDSRFDDQPVTPRASLVWALTRRLTAKYTYAEAYVAPAPYFASASFDNGTVIHVPNPDLEPEEAVSHELTLQYSDSHVNVVASTYYGEQNNLILLSEDGSMEETVLQDPVYLEDGSTRILNQTINAGESRNAGLDLAVRATLGSFSPWASYSYVDYEETLFGVETGLRGISHHNARLGVTWAAGRGLFVTPSLILRSTPERVRAGRLGSELDHPWELNLHALWQASDRIDVFATVRNATDHEVALGGVTGDAVPQESLRAFIGIRGSL